MDSQNNKQEHIRDAPSGPFFHDGSHSTNPPHFREQPSQGSAGGLVAGPAGGSAGASINRGATYGVTPSALKTETASGWGQDLISNIEEVHADTPVSNVPSNTRVIPTTVIASDGMNRKDGLPHVIGNAPPGSDNNASREDSNLQSGSLGGVMTATAGNVASGVSNAVESVKETAAGVLPNTREPNDPSVENQSASYLQQGDGKSHLPETREPRDPTASNQSAPFTKQGDLSQGTGTVAGTVGSAYDSVATKAAQVLEKAADVAGSALDTISGDGGSEGVNKSPTHGGIPTSAGPPTS